MDFYTYSGIYKGHILEKGYSNNKLFKRIVSFDDWKPYLFVPTKNQTKYKSIYGVSVEKKIFDNIYSAKEFIKKYKDISGFSIFGLQNFEYLYLNDQYPDLNPDVNLISICSIDIEVDKNSQGRFADIQKADGKVLCLTLIKFGDKKISLGLVDYDKPNYIKCQNEIELLNKFIEYWQSFNIDVITGWNIETYDIPYLINRIKKILGEKEANKLSPFGILLEGSIEIKGKEQQVYTPLGISILDYMALYKKFRLIQRESYALGFICQEELGITKIDYSEYGSLHNLYSKNPQLFISYNIRDTDLIEELEKKFQYIKLVFQIAYFAKVNFTDALTSVKLWDVIIHNFLMKRNIIIPPYSKDRHREQLDGAFVKEPKIGESKWVFSEDFTSLYPKLQETFNISPEKFINKLEIHDSVDDILNGSYNRFSDILIENNCCITANHCLFSCEGKGFLVELIEILFDERQKNKKLMIEAKKKQEQTKENLEYEIQKYDTIQYALKILLNSLYGSLGNPGSRFYSNDFAESITLTGQLAIQFMAIKMNEYLNKITKKNIDWVIASDTDSVYISLEPLINDLYEDQSNTKQIIKFIQKCCEEDFSKRINGFCEDLIRYTNAFQNKLDMKLECIADKAIWVAKKKYVLNVHHQEGVDYSEPKLKIMGIESVRSSTPAACRKSLKKALEIIMQGNENDVQEYISKFKIEFLNLSFEEIAFPRTLNNLDEYHDPNMIAKKGTPIHVYGALIFNHLLRQNDLTNKYPLLFSGQKIKFSYLKQPNPYGSHVITVESDLPDELNIEKYIDRDMQFQKSFLDPLNNILKAINWNAEQTSNLEKFFGGN